MLSVVISSVIILFILIFLGFFIGKRGIINKEYTPDLSRFVIEITMPVTVFCSIIGQDNTGGLNEIWQMMVLAGCFHLGSFLLGQLIVRIGHIPEKERGIWIFNFMFSNNGFMGLPLALAIFGNDGLFMMAICNVISNLLIFSVGLKLCTKYYPVKEKINIRKMFVNNINIAVVIGFVCYLCHLHVPDVVVRLLDYISNITAGFSMIVVGLSLSRMNLRDVFANKKLFVMTGLRLILIPLLCIGVFRLLPFEVPELLYMILILTAALPSASSQSMLTEQYKTNVQDAGRAVFLTTLCSVVTIPVVMAIAL